ncbi:MAG: SRPBCC domain-containing protein [Rhizobiaceae bacterium]
MSTSEKPDFVLETYIKTTPKQLWEALTDGEITKHYFQGDASVESSFVVGADYVYTSGDGNKMLIGEILEASPYTRLAMTFLPTFMDRPEKLSHNVYEIEELAESCKLTISHFGVTPELQSVRNGWAKIAARLKTWLESGESLNLAEAG